MSAEPIRTPAGVGVPQRRSSSRRERRTIFRRGWLLVGHVSPLREPGDYVTMYARRRADRGGARARTASCARSRTSAATAAARVARRHRQLRQGDPLPLPRLDIRPRRPAAGRCPRRRGSPGSTRTRTASGRCSCGVAAGFVFASLDRRPEPLSDVTSARSRVARALSARAARALSDSSRPCFRSTGRTRSTTTSRATTSRSAIPACCGCSTTSSYLVETTDAHVSIARSPMRDKASRNRQERLYQRLVRPMPGLRAPEADQWNFVFAFPGATVNLYPDQIDFWLNYPLDERRTLHGLEHVPAARDGGPPRPAGAAAERAHQPPRAGRRTTSSPSASRRGSDRASTAPA